jgi:signal transduction histidine kinase
VTRPNGLGVVAHELRNAVAALLALAERAGRRDLPVETVRRLAVLAVASGRDIERMLSDPDLLSLRLETAAVADLVGPFLGPNVTGSVDASSLVCDATRLRQAVGNLVANGLRHGTSVTIEAGVVGDEIVIEVRDDGPGVSEGLDVFAEGVSGSGSTGYGLWLARAIAEAHGGTLRVVGGADDGATFRLAVPRSPRGRG